MKTIISLSTIKEFPEPTVEKQLLAAKSRIQALVKGNVNQRTAGKSTYAGTTEIKLINEVKKILAQLIKSGALVAQNIHNEPLQTLMPNTMASGNEARYSVFIPGDAADTHVVAVSQFKFGSSDTYGFILSLAL